MGYDFDPLCYIAYRDNTTIYFRSAANRESKSVAGAVFIAFYKHGKSVSISVLVFVCMYVRRYVCTFVYMFFCVCKCILCVR